MVFDITNEASFKDINEFWLNEVESYSDRDVTIMLIGNKSDITDKNGRVISTEKA